jgi:hypothetical protein
VDSCVVYGIPMLDIKSNLHWTKDPMHYQVIEILKINQILTCEILRVGTYSIHICSLKSLLFFIIKIYYIYFFFFLLCAWYAQQPMTKLDFIIFSCSLPRGLISIMPNAVVVCHPLSFFPLVVRCPILHAIIVQRLCRPLPSLSAVAVIVCHCCCCLMPPSSATAAIIATLLSPLSLAACSCPSPL